MKFESGDVRRGKYRRPRRNLRVQVLNRSDRVAPAADPGSNRAESSGVRSLGRKTRLVRTLWPKKFLGGRMWGGGGMNDLSTTRL
jgi:hypothetical protein